MTEKLFYEDSYLCIAMCEVEEVIEKNDKLEIVLKSTIFYPEGGGQPCDLGTIAGMQVEYVYEKETEAQGDVVYHVVHPAIMKDRPFPGDIVECSVDYNRRFDLTQQHSGEHLLSGAFFRLFGAVNAGFHLGEDYVTIDMDCKGLTTEMIREAESVANTYIYENKPIKTYFVQKEDALKLPLRKELKAEGRIRIVEMADGAECSACCGTHVKQTGEVGLIKILKHESYKGMTRIYFKCGQRALEDYKSKHNCMLELSRMFSSEASEVVAKVKNQWEQLSELKQKLIRLINLLAAEEAQVLQSSGDKLVVKEYNEEEFDFLERVYDQLKEQQITLILSSLKDRRLLYASDTKDGTDCGKEFRESLKQHGGRGGGNAKRAQASFESVEAMRAYAAYLSAK